MKNKVLICAELLKYPNRGLGRVSFDFTEALSQNSALDFSYLLAGSSLPKHLSNAPTVRLNTWRKFDSSYMQQYAICHVLHQLPKFSFSKARKTVLTIHDLNFLYTKNKKKQQKYHKMVQSAVDKADAIGFISHFTREECFRHLSIPASKITQVIYNGVNALADPSPRPDWCPESPFLFTIGQFLNKKNFHVLLPFMRKLPENISLIIAGENNTSYGAYLKKEILTRGLRNRVILPGPVSEAEKSYLYHNCKAFVFPSIAEGFGLPVIEAMKCGKAVFCSDKTSLKEIGGRHAFFWTNFDAGHMLKVYEEGTEKFENSTTAIVEQTAYANSFTWKTNVDSYIQLYQHLLEL
jgi:glycosyltransferase involved in cell wall biosynthesis